MEAGLCHAGKIPFYYASLGNRPVLLSDIQALIRFLENTLETTQPHPLLLLSCCPGFAALPEEEEQGLVAYAGQYRALQQSYKQTGRQVFSYIHQIAVGGTYLMHGLSATCKVADPQTVFYDTIPSCPPVALSDAVNHGLVDEAVPPGNLMDWLETRLAL